MRKACSCREHKKAQYRGSGLDRGLFLYDGILPICSCGHHWEKHLSGDRMNHYGQCRIFRCECEDFKSDNLKYLEYQYEQNH